MSLDLINKINEIMSDRPNYKAYNIRNTEIFYGVPPVPIKGLQYIFARHDAPQVKLIKCLTGKGVFVPNQNSSGIIELGIMSGSVSCAGIQIMELTGIPFPFLITDTSSGGTSTVVASACRRVGTPEWRRDGAPGIDIFTFATPRLLLSDGLRLLA